MYGRSGGYKWDYTKSLDWLLPSCDTWGSVAYQMGTWNEGKLHITIKGKNGGTCHGVVWVYAKESDVKVKPNYTDDDGK